MHVLNQQQKNFHLIVQLLIVKLKDLMISMLTVNNNIHSPTPFSIILITPHKSN